MWSSASGCWCFGAPGLDDVVVALVVGAAVLSQQGFLLGQMLLRSRLAFATAAILMVVVGGITLLGGLALLPLGVVGLAASQALAQAAGLGVALRLGPPTPRPGWDADVARRLIGIGLPLMLAGIAFLVLTTIDRWLVLAFLGSEALGVYGIVGLAVSAPIVVVAIISQQAYPRLAFALGAGRPGSEILAMARRQSRIAFGIGMAVVLAIGTAGWFGIPVFLPEYDAARVPLLLALIGRAWPTPASSGDANVLTTIGAQKEYLVIQVAAIARLPRHRHLAARPRARAGGCRCRLRADFRGVRGVSPLACPARDPAPVRDRWDTGRRPAAGRRGGARRPVTNASSREIGATVAVETWARSWFEDADGVDRLSIDGLPCGPALHVEVAHVVGDAVSDHLGRSGRRCRAARAALAQAVGSRPSGPRLDVAPARARWTGRLRMHRPSMACRSSRSWPRRRPSMGSRRWRGRCRHHRPSPPRTRARSDAGGRPASNPRRSSWASWPSAGPFAPPDATATDRWQQVSRDPRPLVVDGVDLTAVALEAVRPLVRRSTAVARRRVGRDPRVPRTGPSAHRPAGHRPAPDRPADGAPGPAAGDPVDRPPARAPTGDPRLSPARGRPDGGLERGFGRLVRRPWRRPAGDDRRRQPAARLGRARGRPTRADATRRGRRRLAGSRILLAMSVAPVESNRAVVDTAIDALRRLPAASLTIKLHPGGSDWTDALRSDTWGPDVRDRVTVLDREPIEPLLADADVVVAHRSTVVGEALAAGRPW